MRLLVGVAAVYWLLNEWACRWLSRQPDYIEWLRHTGPSQHVSIFCLQS